MMNNVGLVGRLTRDVELRFLANNTAVASASIAVNRKRKNKNGEREADFLNLVVWGKSAENFANWLKKGSLVAIEGELRTRNYENNQGQRVYVVEVLVTNWDSLVKDSQQANNGNGYPSQGDINEHFGSDHMDFNDDDLPF